jgi:hypothetical protein
MKYSNVFKLVNRFADGDIVVIEGTYDEVCKQVQFLSEEPGDDYILVYNDQEIPLFYVSLDE